MYTRAVLATWPASATGTAARTTSKRPVRRIEHSLHAGGGTGGNRTANPGEPVGNEAEILAAILGIERGGTGGNRTANPGPQVVLSEAVGDEAEILAAI